MMNNFQINRIQINRGKNPIQIPEGVLIFNGVQLCANSDVVALTVNKYDLPNFNLSTYKSPLIDNGGVVSHLVADRDIEFEVYIRGETEEQFGDNVLEFKKKISRREGILKVRVGTKDLFCRASVTEFRRQDTDSRTAATFRLSFKSLENLNPQQNTQLVYPNILGDFQGGIVNEGARQSNLSMYLVFTTAASLNELEIRVNGFPIKVSYPFAANDILFINSEDGLVEVNGVEIDYDGLLPSIETNFDSNGFNPVEFIFEPGSTVDTTITLFYIPQFV